MINDDQIAEHTLNTADEYINRSIEGLEEDCNMDGTDTPAEFQKKSIDAHFKIFEKNSNGKHMRLFGESNTKSA